MKEAEVVALEDGHTSLISHISDAELAELRTHYLSTHIRSESLLSLLWFIAADVETIRRRLEPGQKL